MERFSFADDVAFVPRGDLLDGVTIAPLTQPTEEGALVKAANFRFAPGGRIRRHPGTDPQIIAVLEGSGEVSGADGVDEPIGPGEAVFLHEGEDHELRSEAGLTALIIEGETLDRYRLVAGRRAEPPQRARDGISHPKPSGCSPHFADNGCGPPASSSRSSGRR